MVKCYLRLVEFEVFAERPTGYICEHIQREVD